MSSRVRFAVLVATVLCASFAAAQDGRWNNDRDHDRNDGYYGQDRRDDRRFYDQGYRDGRNDREHRRQPNIRNRGWDHPSDRNAYITGYRAGYGNHWSGRDDDRWGRNEGWGRNDRRGGYGYPSADRTAYRLGFEDGARHALEDRRRGKNYRPTKHDDYKDGDRGYSKTYGNKNAYKDRYRDGFRAGYDRAWNGRGYYGG